LPVKINKNTCIAQTNLQDQIYNEFGISPNNQRFPNLNIFNSAVNNNLNNGCNVIVEDEPMRILSGLIYIPVIINDYKCRAILDTGAQVIMMSYEFIEAIKCTNMIDRRMQGICKGVGESNIVGQIPHLLVYINNQSYLLNNIHITDTPGYIFLLSIEFMRKNNTIINTITNEIILGTQNPYNHVKMLSDKDTNDFKQPFKVDIKYLFYETKSSHSQSDEFTRLLKIISNNIIKNPTDVKFKTIKKNEKVNNLIYNNQSTKNFITKLGFQDCGNELLFRGSIDNISQLCQCF
jgi:hypothetical protein